MAHVQPDEGRVSITTALLQLRAELQKLGPGYPEVELKMTFEDPMTAQAFKNRLQDEFGYFRLVDPKPSTVTMLAGVRLRFMYKQHREGEI